MWRGSKSSGRDCKRNTQVTTRTLNSSDLYELLYDTLLTTEKVKRTLKTNCDEATYVLKPWQVEITVENRANDICTRKKIARENKTEEVTAEIGRVINLAQELREKLKLNVTLKKKISKRKDTLENIYLPNSMIVNNRKRSNVVTQRINTAKNPVKDCEKLIAPQSDKTTSVATQSSKSISTLKQSTTDKLQSKVSSIKIVQSKREKNFILENKLKVKKISLTNKLQADSNSDSNITFQNSRKLVSPETSAAALNDLIHNITRRSTEDVLTSSLDSNTFNCLVHKENYSVQEKLTSIDLMEALYYFDVPNEIVKILRTYHALLKTETHSLRSKDSKTTRSIDSFLNKFEAMNIAIQDLSQDSHLLKTTANSISAFSMAFSNYLDSIRINGLKNTVVKLASALKQYNKEDIVEPIVKESFCNFSLTRGWMSNGIWNTSCMENFKSFSTLYNITYCDKKQLLSLYEAIQKIQLTEYQNKLIRIVLCNVIPAVKSKSVDSSSAEYAQIYKTMFILCQGLNPKVPVLVSTDS